MLQIRRTLQDTRCYSRVIGQSRARHQRSGRRRRATKRAIWSQGRPSAKQPTLPPLMASLTAFVPTFASASEGNLLHLHRKVDSGHHLGIHKLHSALYLLRGLVRPNWCRCRSTKEHRERIKVLVLVLSSINIEHPRPPWMLVRVKTGLFALTVLASFQEANKASQHICSQGIPFFDRRVGAESRIWVENACHQAGGGECLSPGEALVPSLDYVAFIPIWELGRGGVG